MIRQLNHTFVSGWQNIKGQEKYAGSSNTHEPTWAAKTVNYCSGHHNIQMFFLTKDGRVLLCLPGYWDAPNFLSQMQFAINLAKVYYDSKLEVAAKNETFLDMQLTRAYGNSASVANGSKLQGFDVAHVKKNAKDFVRTAGFVGGIKTADQVLHERMAERPFVPFEKFDTPRYIDMGIKRYKYDFGVPGKDKYSSMKPGAEKTSTKASDGPESTPRKGKS